MILLLLPVAAIAVAVGTLFGWRWVLAPLLGWAILTWLLGSLRALVHAGRMGVGEPVDPHDVEDGRTLFWCEECGTEVLLLVRGTDRAPSHCGQRMHERTELAN
jgi:hypothetical protein